MPWTLMTSGGAEKLRLDDEEVMTRLKQRTYIETAAITVA
jgi:hypothetical protein